MKKPFSLSFVFPMYNEIDNIEPCVHGAMAIGNKLGIDYEIVVVDDASTDGSGALADQLARRYPVIRVIHHEVNRKLGGALKTGFAHATKDYILYMDSDLPLDFDDVKNAIPQIGDADMLIGYRLTRDEPLRRKVISKVYNLMIRLIFGLKVRDVNFSFKLFKREIYQNIVLKSEGSFIDAELLLEAHRRGYTIREIGLVYHPRVAGQSTLASTSVIKKVFVEMWRYYKTRNSWQNKHTDLVAPRHSS
ncbi:glycosyltransferase family 2 protein [Sporolituus thermophilus]|uniref:Glycosyltransferase involved in cell wall bisynthesis n=1 Tax=Sporolituus thermophilus DSM 23256 TaxID=1123285 RepID=A0A1G7K7U1_9FIRM|nr:glycosyltransferase family 2 protein [Sporolituus thermophilus]SDF33242.1 Glycosyltransferase involved in cell wall bisynthesis [Sporolituus thermophilus DSM 23256]